MSDDFLRTTWERSDDMAYFTIADGESDFQIFIDDDRCKGHVVLDFSPDGRLIGIELIDASEVLGEAGMYLIRDAPEPADNPADD